MALLKELSKEDIFTFEGRSSEYKITCITDKAISIKSLRTGSIYKMLSHDMDRKVSVTNP